MGLPWIRLDTAIYASPAVLDLTERPTGYRAMTVYFCGLSYAATHDTSGDIPRAALRVIHGRPSDAERLVGVGLWQPFDGGWWIADWGELTRPERRPHIPLSIRRAVYERDGFACLACGTADRLTLDHIQHYSAGGPDTVENLRTLCRSCNSSRKDRTDEEWMPNGA